MSFKDKINNCCLTLKWSEKPLVRNASVLIRDFIWWKQIPLNWFFNHKLGYMQKELRLCRFEFWFQNKKTDYEPYFLIWPINSPVNSLSFRLCYT